MGRFLIYNFSGDVDEISHLFPSDRFARLAAMIAAEGHAVQILDRANFEDIIRVGPAYMAHLAQLDFDATSPEHEALLEAEAEAILERDPDAVFVNLWHGTGFKFSFDLVRRLKARRASLKLYGIGQKVDEFKEDILRFAGGALDALVAGLGYNAVAPLIRGDDTAAITNLFYQRDGKITANPIVPINVDDYPDPCYEEATYGHIGEKVPLYPITLSNQACPNRCAFCIRPENYGRVIQRRSVERVLAELRDNHLRRGATHFRVEDSTPPRGALTELARAILDSDLAGRLTLSAFSRVDMNAGEDFALMKKAGFLALFFGIESLDDDNLQRLRKGTRYEDVRRTVTRAHEAGILTVGSFIFPTPGETRESMRNTLRRIRELQPVLDSVLVLPAGVQPHTEWARHPEAYGIRLDEDYIRQALIYPIKYLVPIQHWKPFPFTYRLMGREASETSFRDIIEVQSEFLEVVRKEYGIPGVPDYYVLLAHLLKRKPDEVLKPLVGAMMQRDYQALRGLFREPRGA